MSQTAVSTHQPALRSCRTGRPVQGVLPESRYGAAGLVPRHRRRLGSGRRREPIHRDDTVCAWDSTSCRPALDFVLHEHGVAEVWAAHYAQIGDRLVVSGPSANQLLPENYSHSLVSEPGRGPGAGAVERPTVAAARRRQRLDECTWRDSNPQPSDPKYEGARIVPFPRPRLWTRSSAGSTGLTDRARPAGKQPGWERPEASRRALQSTKRYPLRVDPICAHDRQRSRGRSIA